MFKIIAIFFIIIICFYIIIIFLIVNIDFMIIIIVIVSVSKVFLFFNQLCFLKPIYSLIYIFYDQESFWNFQVIVAEFSSILHHNQLITNGSPPQGFNSRDVSPPLKQFWSYIVLFPSTYQIMWAALEL